MVSTDQVKELRDQTGVSVMQCKKALEEAGGDMNKALIILRKKGGEAAGKKADRTLGAGLVQAYIHGAGAVGVMIELACETDFVSGNVEFKALAHDIAMHIAASNPEFLRKEDITEEARSLAKEVFEKEMNDKPENKNKPAEVKNKIIEGKLAAYFAERVLLDQPFIKNPEVTVSGLIEAAIQKFGEKIQLNRYVRYSVLNR
jgi:elongation factor Ts